MQLRFHTAGDLPEVEWCLELTLPPLGCFLSDELFFSFSVCFLSGKSSYFVLQSIFQSFEESQSCLLVFCFFSIVSCQQVLLVLLFPTCSL